LVSWLGSHPVHPVAHRTPGEGSAGSGVRLVEAGLEPGPRLVRWARVGALDVA
jgi:hypothetical protein